MSCKRARGFLEQEQVALPDPVDARKERMGPEEAVALVRKAKRLVVAKGKKVVEHEVSGKRPADEEVVKLVIGPSGNLRAPTLRIGDTLVVGYNEDALREALAS